MHKSRSGSYQPLSALLAGAMIWGLCLAGGANAQQRFKPDNRAAVIDAGTMINVRTNGEIKARESDGQIFTGVVDEDVISRNGAVAIPKGSDVNMVVRRISNSEVALDLDSISVNNQLFTVQSDSTTASSARREGIGANKRTGTYIGGGALLGAIIGGIAGGGKGAIIGAGAGAAAGAGAQVLTRGQRVSIPAESLLTFRLTQPMQVSSVYAGYNRNSRNNPTYSGRRDDERYSNSTDAGNVRIRSDHNITWNASVPARIYVQVDNQPRKLFARAESGTQSASWMSNGHRYVFIMVDDEDGSEIARDVLDLR